MGKECVHNDVDRYPKECRRLPGPKALFVALNREDDFFAVERELVAKEMPVATPNESAVGKVLREALGSPSLHNKGYASFCHIPP